MVFHLLRLEVDVFSHRSSAKRYLVRVAVQDASRSPMFVAGIQDENMLGLSAVEQSYWSLLSLNYESNRETFVSS
ncbi:uncharacterized protein LOC113287264 isoform X5 [Papaver somniferum]|uniref:uncharacterized protein LOC113287262 isoform X5 n=1 Tax=Papaver somniferum TaxID=3469 RepID=UPI000E6F6E52|nr:uncharacterized protein LOC113287262 isoform X5 [Papaver somniferum]XP_026391740.1 uncharacterized protein LOC113287264 isoform X5 [Papaver somniferum]